MEQIWSESRMERRAIELGMDEFRRVAKKIAKEK